MLPGVGIFDATMQNFRAQSPVRPFYGVTIPLVGHCMILDEGNFGTYHQTKAHLQHPDKPVDVKFGEDPSESLQLCFDQAALDSIARKMGGLDGRKGPLMETLNLARPAARSFARHATFVWSELLRGGSIVTSPLIAQESAHLLMALLVEAAGSDATDLGTSGRGCSPAAVRKAEEYLMGNLANPISIADVAFAAGTSARNLSREFRRHRGTTIKGFIRERRLEAANRALLAAEPGQTNVTQVALELGFEHFGRFSGDYKKAFGELPSETLAR